MYESEQHHTPLFHRAFALDCEFSKARHLKITGDSRGIATLSLLRKVCVYRDPSAAAIRIAFRELVNKWLGRMAAVFLSFWKQYSLV